LINVARWTKPIQTKENSETIKELYRVMLTIAKKQQYETNLKAVAKVELLTNIHASIPIYLILYSF
jgi:hypothetical protein